MPRRVYAVHQRGVEQMKAVIVEVKGRSAAVLYDDGQIAEVRNQNYTIGQVIEIKEFIKRKRRFIPIAAAAAVLMLMFSTGAYAYYTPYSYVSLDVNPSIEYSLNRFDRVLKVTGVNDDGKEIVKELSLERLGNKKIDEAIALTIKQIEEEGFFEGNLEGGIVISTSAKDLKRSERLAADLQENAEKAVAKENVEVEAYAVGLERVLKAHELGVTPGKLNLVEKLRDSAEDSDMVDMEEWLDKPVKEIMYEIKMNREKNKLDSPPDDPSESKAKPEPRVDADMEKEKNEEKNVEKNKEKNEDKNVEKNKEKNDEKNVEKNKEKNVEKNVEKNKEKNEEKNKEKNEEDNNQKGKPENLNKQDDENQDEDELKAQKEKDSDKKIK